ncbi:hypothetical protein MRX96_031147 [Rhipicephalus microplus]
MGPSNPTPPGHVQSSAPVLPDGSRYDTPYLSTLPTVPSDTSEVRLDHSESVVRTLQLLDACVDASRYPEDVSVEKQSVTIGEIDGWPTPVQVRKTRDRRFYHNVVFSKPVRHRHHHPSSPLIRRHLESARPKTSITQQMNRANQCDAAAFRVSPTTNVGVVREGLSCVAEGQAGSAPCTAVRFEYG